MLIDIRPDVVLRSPAQQRFTADQQRTRTRYNDREVIEAQSIGADIVDPRLSDGSALSQILVDPGCNPYARTRPVPVRW